MTNFLATAIGYWLVFAFLNYVSIAFCDWRSRVRRNKKLSSFVENTSYFGPDDIQPRDPPPYRDGQV